MNMMGLLAALAVGLALGGCASTASRSEASSSQIYTSAKEGAASVKPIVTMQRGQNIHIFIESTSPQVDGKRVPNKFEVVGIEGKRGEPYTIVVAPRCDCLGFRKWSVYPVASMLDQNGEPVGTVEQVGPKNRVLRGTFPQDGVFKLVLIADNTEEGTKLGNVAGFIGGVTVFNIAETVHGTGRVEVNFQLQP